MKWKIGTSCHKNTWSTLPCWLKVSKFADKTFFLQVLYGTSGFVTPFSLMKLANKKIIQKLLTFATNVYSGETLTPPPKKKTHILCLFKINTRISFAGLLLISFSQRNLPRACHFSQWNLNFRRHEARNDNVQKLIIL